MKARIRQIFSSLKNERKDNVRTIISQQYGKSLDTVKNHWLLKGTVPTPYQEGVLEILETELESQISEDKKILAQ